MTFKQVVNASPAATQYLAAQPSAPHEQTPAWSVKQVVYHGLLRFGHNLVSIVDLE